MLFLETPGHGFGRCVVGPRRGGRRRKQIRNFTQWRMLLHTPPPCKVCSNTTLSKTELKVTIDIKMSHHVELFKITKVTNSHNFTTKVINIHCKYIVFTLCLTELSTVSKYLRVTVKRDEKVVHNTLTEQSKL